MSALITIEGIEGCGKTTLITKLAEFYQPRFKEVVVTRQPGATPIGEKIRRILLDPENKELCPTAELLLFAADRAQHVAQIIRPALARGALVICDRYTHSTLAYQGFGRKISFAVLNYLNALATEDLRPDLVLLLDIDPELGLTRAEQRSSSAKTAAEKALDFNRFEQQQLEFHSALRHGFLQLAQDPANKFAVIDAAQLPERVFADAAEAVNRLLEQKQAPSTA